MLRSRCLALAAACLLFTTTAFAAEPPRSGIPIFIPKPAPAATPNCVSGTPNITADTVGFFATAGTSGTSLRSFFCVSAASPSTPPAFSGGQQSAYTWLSNQLDPGSNGNIRSLYQSVAVSWGTLNWPSYSSACGCSQSDFNTVVTQIRSEISAVANVQALFNAISTYYVNPLFISETGVVFSTVTTLSLPNQPVTINTGAVLENTVLSVLNDAFSTAVGDINPYGPVAISALLNLSSINNGGPVPNQFATQAAQLESDLPSTFGGIITQLGSLNSSIIGDYSLFMALGGNAPNVTVQQLGNLANADTIAYKKQLFRDLLPLVTNVVFYAPNDGHEGGGGAVYTGNDASTYSQANPGNQITYLHYAGFFWNSKTYYTTTQQLLTSNSTYDSGDAITGALCANNILADGIYQAVFTELNFSYDELLSLNNMQTRQQCSLCSGSSCNSSCRPNNSCLSSVAAKAKVSDKATISTETKPAAKPEKVSSN